MNTDARPHGRIIDKVSADRLREDLNYLCVEPLRYRKANYHRPGASLSSLDEADEYIVGRLESVGYEVTKRGYRVQAFRCDEKKPVHHWYSRPEPSDPWYTAYNLEVTRPGVGTADEIVQLVSHKDSMSWIDSPGAHDNAVGTVANIEICRALAECRPKRTIRILFCNEEHVPWTSRFAAETAAARGDRIIAVLNVDAIDGKSDDDSRASLKRHVVLYSTDEGRCLADHIIGLAEPNSIELAVETGFKEHINDDDGMFINAGYRSTVMNIGSWPYADSEYHLPGDTPDRVDMANLVASTQLILAAVVDIAENDLSG